MSVAPVGPVFILVRPQLGENIGAAARAMLNFGMTELRLVAPECGWPNAKAVVACSGAFPVLNGARVFGSVREAIADLHALFATTARPRDLRKAVVTAAQAASSTGELMAGGRRVGILFGAERTGLTNEELLLADAIVSIPLNPAFSSLNLAQAVLLVAHELHAAAGTPGSAASLQAEDEPATKEDVEGLLTQLIAALDAVDFFKSEDRRRGLVRTIKVMIERRGWTKPEIHLFRGIIKEIAQGGAGRAP